MQIDAIFLRELNLPLLRPFQTSFGVTKDRRVVLAEIHSEGLVGWGECTAGEHPHFSEESVDSCWQVIVDELGPLLAASTPENGGEVPRILNQVRGNRMAKATLENAIWDLEAQRKGISLSQLLGGVRDNLRARGFYEHLGGEPDLAAGHHHEDLGQGGLRGAGRGRACRSDR